MNVGGPGLTPDGLSIGYLENAIPIIETVYNEPHWTHQELYHEFNLDSIRFRGNSERIIQLGLRNRWMEIELAGYMVINPNLKNYLGKEVELLREMFLLYIKETKPHWRKFIRKGIENCKAHISDDDIQQIFRELGLYSPDPNEHTQLWWNRARNFVRYEEGIENTITGDKGEIESYRYELARTGITPTLVAQESENYDTIWNQLWIQKI